MLPGSESGGHPLTGYQRRSLGIDAPLDPTLVHLLVRAGLHVSGVNDHPSGGMVNRMHMASPAAGMPRPHPALRQAQPGPMPGMLQANPAPAPPALGPGGLLGANGPMPDMLEQLRSQLLSGGSNQGLLRSASRARQVSSAMQRLHMLQQVHPALRQAHPGAM